MKKTVNYKLNQWELEDRILMSDFNEDNAKIDAAVAAAMAKAVSEGKRLDGALSTAKSQLQNSISTSKTQVQTELAAAKKELQDRIGAERAELDAALHAAENRANGSLEAARAALEAEDRRLDGTKLELVKVMTMVVPASSATTRQVDVSNIDFGSFLMFSIHLENLNKTWINFNKMGKSYFSYLSSSDLTAGALGFTGDYKRGAFLFFPMKNPDALIACRQIEGGFTSGYTELAYKDIQTLDLINDNRSTPTLTILGVR